MSTKIKRIPVAAAGLALALAVAGPPAAGVAGKHAPGFSDPTRIDNPYLPLSKFSRCVLRGHESGKHQRIVRTVLDRTRTFEIGGERVEAMVVRDRVRQLGKPIERTFDYFAQDDRGTVHYLGESVDNIRNGQVVNHDGSWLYGRDTKTIGVLMPAHPRVGDRWRSEVVPQITNEADRVVDRVARVRVHGRTYEHAIRVREYALPDKEVEHKVYARGVGVVEELPPEGAVGLVGCTRA